MVEGLRSSYLSVVSAENLVTSTIVPEEWDANIGQLIQQVCHHGVSSVTAHMSLFTCCFEDATCTPISCSDNWDVSIPIV